MGSGWGHSGRHKLLTTFVPYRFKLFDSYNQEEVNSKIMLIRLAMKVFSDLCLRQYKKNNKETLRKEASYPLKLLLPGNF